MLLVSPKAFLARPRQADCTAVSHASERSDAGPLGDQEIHAHLLSRLRLQHARKGDAIFIEELGLCRGHVRVDVAVVNGSIHGYEIKSDKDSLRRLATQVAVYGRVLDRASLVVGTKNLDDAVSAIPTWWGVQLAERRRGEVVLKRLRPGHQNPARDPRTLVELLWLEEALTLLEARGGTRGFLGRPRRQIWDRVCELYNVDEIAGAVRRQIKARTGQLSFPPRV